MRTAPALVLVLAGLLCLGLATRASSPAAALDSAPRIHEYEIELAVPGPSGSEYLTVHLYAVDDGSDMAQREAEGRAAFLARFPGASIVEPGGVSAAFKLFPTPVRWPQPSASWLYNPGGATNAMPADAALAAIKAGAAGWDNAGGSGFHFDYLGPTTTATGCNGDVSQYSKDGKNVVGWGHIVGGHLGYSCHWRGPSLVAGTPYFAIQEIDVIFEPLFAYSAASLQALALHEFGHALGLDHTEPPLCPGEAMCAGANAMLFPQPQADDINGVVALYGASSTPTVPPGPRPYTALAPAVAKD